jgi:hypothetical protein
MRSFTNYYFGYQMKKREMGRPYGTCGKKDRCMQGFGREI